MTADVKALMEEARVLLEAATPGPWRYTGGHIIQGREVTLDVKVLPRTSDDGRLMAAAPSLTARLLAALEQEQARGEAGKKALRDLMPFRHYRGFNGDVSRFQEWEGAWDRARAALAQLEGEGA